MEKLIAITLKILFFHTDVPCCIIASTAQMLASDGALESRGPQLSNAVLEFVLRSVFAKLQRQTSRDRKAYIFFEKRTFLMEKDNTLYSIS